MKKSSGDDKVISNHLNNTVKVQAKESINMKNTGNPFVALALNLISY